MRMPCRLQLFCLLLFGLLTTLASFPAPFSLATETPLHIRIGLLAKRGSSIDVQLWTATADYLTTRLPEYRFEIVPLDFTEIHASVEEARIDFVLANSAFYVELEKLHGVSRIATLINRNLPHQQTTTFGGVIFCRADHTDIRTITDLRDRRFMAVEPRSFGGWIACWRELDRQGIDPLRFFASLEYGNTHDAVVQAVMEGRVDAGTVRTDTLERMAESGRIRLDDVRLLNEQQVAGFPFKLSTTLYPEWPMAAIRTTPADLVRKVAAALLAMPADDPAALASKSAGWTAPLNYQPVHDCLLDLRIGPYVDLAQFTLTDVLRRYWRQIIIVLLVVSMSLLASLAILLLNRRLRQKTHEIEELNTSLEAKVVERTEQINTLLDRELYLREIMETIAKVDSLLLSASSLDTLLGAACRVMGEHSHYGFIWIGLVHNTHVEHVFTSDTATRLPEGFPYSYRDEDDPFAASSEALCVTTNQTVVRHKHDQEATVTPWLDRANPVVFNALVALPLRADRAALPLGVLCVYTRRWQGFEPEEIAMLEELAGDIGFAIHSFRQREQVARLESERSENYRQTIRSFADMIDQRDTYTAGHTRRVADYSRLLAQHMGLEAERIDFLEQAAILHDIGKIATPDSVLLKPGKLSALDYDLIKLHASAGHAMLAGIPMYRELAEIIRHHHERYDGTGYPDKLQGAAIPLLARIMSVADAFDAMTTNRIYKPRKTVPEALHELQQLSGSQFDPAIVNVSLDCFATADVSATNNQLPKSQMEQRRFSYFFSDKLTGLYNEDYLQIVLRNSELLDRYHCLHTLHVHHLDQYNRTLGWEQGNQLILRLASELLAHFAEALLFRAYGRDFVIITPNHFDLNPDTVSFTSLKGTGVSVSSTHVDLRQDATYCLDKIEQLHIFVEGKTR